jgi:hypothetical protein
VPANDRFMVITEHDPDNLLIDPGYPDIRRPS